MSEQAQPRRGNRQQPVNQEGEAPAPAPPSDVATLIAEMRAGFQAQRARSASLCSQPVVVLSPALRLLLPALPHHSTHLTSRPPPSAFRGGSVAVVPPGNGPAISGPRPSQPAWAEFWKDDTPILRRSSSAIHFLFGFSSRNRWEGG